MVSGATGDMNAGVKVLRDEYLPLWTTQISDASTLSEFFYLGNERKSNHLNQQPNDTSKTPFPLNDNIVHFLARKINFFDYSKP